MNREQKFGVKALVALATHEDLMQRVAVMKVQIGKHIQACPVSEKLSIHYAGLANHDALIDEKTGRAKTHLWHAFNDLVDHDSGYGKAHMSLDDQENYLTDPWDDESRCEHCYAAWKLIQERKEVRQQLGIAKRSIRALGKVAKGFYQ